MRWCCEYLENFWDAMVREGGIHWFEKYTNVLDALRGPIWSRWFTGRICLDRHIDPRILDLWENESGETRAVNLAELNEQTGRLATCHWASILKRGDRVAILMAPEVVTVLYAGFMFGPIVVPIFARFGPDAIASRLADWGGRRFHSLLAYAEEQWRRVRRYPGN